MVKQPVLVLRPLERLRPQMEPLVHLRIQVQTPRPPLLPLILLVVLALLVQPMLQVLMVMYVIRRKHQSNIFLTTSRTLSTQPQMTDLPESPPQ